VSTHAEAVNTARTKLLELLEKLSKVEMPTARENVQSIVEVANTLNYIGAPTYPLASTSANTAETVTDTKPDPVTSKPGADGFSPKPQCPCPICEFRRARGEDPGVSFQVVDLPLNAQPGEIIASIKAALLNGGFAGPTRGHG
jgi:hypothetical protein